ncbi:hypothetical protein [Nocardioides sp. B-3]|uniref:hypothetical protein n=1 Tax=Nocardioides sp. B-3 TaxID=2895565 RepID=UPI0021527C2A|nr:hypothetical protein [Nocardioides sp. B-3]UUZ61947.1 hypothetical protein LP418_11675 [Nocardioides sp. B-3]
MHGDHPLFMEAAPEPARRDFDTREQRPERGGGKKPERRPRGRTDVDMASYRLAVGKRHKVEPRRSSARSPTRAACPVATSGTSTSAPTSPPVELPRDLPAGTLDRLSGTRISGKLIEIQLDNGAPAGRPARTSTYDKKPRHKS